VKRTIGVAVLAGIAFVATATAASASVTVNDAGKGFIGKGDVQTVLGYNNAALQKAVDGKTLLFTAQVPTAQALTQSVSQDATQSGVQAATQTATQTATQAGTQAVSQELTCTYTNGNGTKTFHRDGDRDGTRAGTATGSRAGSREGIRAADRDGIRTGVQSGVQTGTTSYDLDVEARKNGPVSQRCAAPTARSTPGPSTNVHALQSTWSQKNRRTVNHTATGRPEMGRSAGCRR
jgi:hypothetical protein